MNSVNFQEPQDEIPILGHAKSYNSLNFFYTNSQVILNINKPQANSNQDLSLWETFNETTIITLFAFKTILFDISHTFEYKYVSKKTKY